jgi:sulfate/thiosulfate transport system permease protein
LYEDPRGETAAFAVASLLAFLALLTLALKTFVEWQTQRNYDLAQQPVPELKSDTHA